MAEFFPGWSLRQTFLLDKHSGAPLTVYMGECAMLDNVELQLNFGSNPVHIRFKLGSNSARLRLISR